MNYYTAGHLFTREQLSNAWQRKVLIEKKGYGYIKLKTADANSETRPIYFYKLTIINE